MGNPGVAGLTSIVENGVLFETGVPVTFRFMRNTEKSPSLGVTFRQDIEPSGRYLTTLYGDPRRLPPGWIHGEVTFRSPIVLWAGMYDYQGDEGWKARLSAAYSGKKKLALSKAILRSGHDAIVTVSEGREPYLGEIVDLTVIGEPTPPKRSR